MFKIISKEELEEIEYWLNQSDKEFPFKGDLPALISTIRELQKTQITEAEKDALAFYGDSENYVDGEWASNMHLDRGKQAREARNGK